MDDNTLWQTKLHARLHDPAEKALVLLRDPAGHEGGTSRALHRLLGFDRIAEETLTPDDAGALHGVLFKDGIPAAIYETVRRADHWSAAADRPQWPMEDVTFTTKAGQIKTFKVADGPRSIGPRGRAHPPLERRRVRPRATRGAGGHRPRGHQGPQPGAFRRPDRQGR